MDIVVRGATIVDGTGAPGYRADVGIRDGRIAAIGGSPSGNRVIDATDLVLAPGFIDMHSHSDLQMLAKPDHLAKISQGVTLEVLGQDGLSYAPVDDRTLEGLRTQLAGWNDDPVGFDYFDAEVDGAIHLLPSTYWNDQHRHNESSVRDHCSAWCHRTLHVVCLSSTCAGSVGGRDR